MVEAELRGQVVLVTGASRGLGRALALAFARAGARVAVCARGAGGLEDTVTAVRALGGEALGRTADVTDAPAMRAFVAHVEARWGGVGALVNNASILDARLPLRDVELADWRSVLEVNLTGALIASQAVLPGMRARGTGSIINVSSGVANEPRAEWGAYAVSKAALEALTWNMAREEGGGGVRVNAVDPGRMRTPMRATAYPDEDPATVPEPSEVAGIFLWLASAGSTGVTGQRFRAAGWDG
ncbi:MAG TPA: SDR family oxidoreductase [Longimicrobiales bacterium]|nr:SDR family oxidoreductase [Longimicrobiales bacterium]